MKTKVTFYGGFHNSGEINVIVNMPNTSTEFKPLDYINENQRKKLDRHFCGIKGCKCGGVYRAHYYYNTEKLPF